MNLGASTRAPPDISLSLTILNNSSSSGVHRHVKDVDAHV